MKLLVLRLQTLVKFFGTETGYVVAGIIDLAYQTELGIVNRPIQSNFDQHI